MLVVSAFFSLLIAVADLAGYLLVPGYAENDFDFDSVAGNFVIGLVVLGLGGGLVYLAAAIMFLVWTYRVTVNALALGARGFRGTPGWSVAYWLIPIVNLFRPYQHLCQIDQAASSRDADDWASAPVPGFFLAWWLAWIFGTILDRIQTRAILIDVDLGAAEMPLSVITSTLSIVSALLAAKVVSRISKAQQSHRESHLAAGGQLSQDPFSPA